MGDESDFTPPGAESFSVSVPNLDEFSDLRLSEIQLPVADVIRSGQQLPEYFESRGNDFHPTVLVRNADGGKVLAFYDLQPLVNMQETDDENPDTHFNYRQIARDARGEIERLGFRGCSTRLVELDESQRAAFAKVEVDSGKLELLTGGHGIVEYHLSSAEADEVDPMDLITP